MMVGYKDKKRTYKGMGDLFNTEPTNHEPIT